MNQNELELTNYVVENFQHLMTELERAAIKSVVVNIKHRDGSETKNFLAWHPPDASEETTEELLKDGMQSLRRRVRDRIIRDHSEEVFANKCSQCGRLPRTPRAKQCHHCKHSWR